MISGHAKGPYPMYKGLICVIIQLLLNEQQNYVFLLFTLIVYFILNLTNSKWFYLKELLLSSSQRTQSTPHM